MVFIRLKSSALKIDNPFLLSDIFVSTLIIFPSGEMSTLVKEGRELNLLIKSSLTPISAKRLKVSTKAKERIKFFICKAYFTYIFCTTIKHINNIFN